MNTATLIQRIQADYEFIKNSGDQDFYTQGRFSTTRAMRTVVAMNEEADRDTFTLAMVQLGFNPQTCHIQYRQSRKLSAEIDAL